MQKINENTAEIIQILAKELEPAVWTDTSDSDESVHYFVMGCPGLKREP